MCETLLNSLLYLFQFFKGADEPLVSPAQTETGDEIHYSTCSHSLQLLVYTTIDVLSVTGRLRRSVTVNVLQFKHR